MDVRGERQRLENEVRRTVVVRCVQLVDLLPRAIRARPFERESWPRTRTGDVSAQPLDALALVRRKPHADRAPAAFSENPSRATVKGFGTVDGDFGAAAAARFSVSAFRPAWGPTASGTHLHRRSTPSRWSTANRTRTAPRRRSAEIDRVPT